MKSVDNIFFLLIFLLFSCKNDGKVEPNENCESDYQVVKLDNNRPNLNVSILLDLSDRINPIKYPNSTMEFFERDLGYGDYVEISKKFEIIILSSVRAISRDENNIATRFINFIDNAYFNRVLLFIEIDCSPEEIYMSGSKKSEFKRTISRLNEMNSRDYSNIDKGKIRR